MNLSISCPGRGRRVPGFALVVSLTLLVLLAVVALAMLGLSSIALRTSSGESAAAVARSNARLAVMMALAELQSTLGPDQAVSAPASAVTRDPAQPHWTGAWRSWRWEPVPEAAPDYSEKAARFQRWLVSTARNEDARELSRPINAARTGDQVVALVGRARAAQGAAAPARELVAEKIPVRTDAGRGRLAWAVMDESTKAPIDLAGPATPGQGSLEAATRSAPERPRADVLDAGLAALREPRHLVSLDSAGLLVGSGQADQVRDRIHDFSIGTLGLLTDVARGGFKTDLTQAFEAGSIPQGLFASATPYPAGFATADGAPTWAYLHNHYRKYKTLRSRGGELSYAPDNATDLRVVRKGPGGRLTGVEEAPATERLLPVIARFQLVFSLVAHSPMNVDNPSRRAFLDQSGNPRGWSNYGVVHLAYDPVVTLYNPYDVALELSKVRIRVWDPPVGFRFTKKDTRAGTQAYFRPGGVFAGLAEMQIDNQSNHQARKCFTLVLADGSGQRLDASLKLRPGEVRVFSPRVEERWEWGWETRGGYSMSGATFFDWNVNMNFGNVDNRPTQRFGRFGVECAPGWDTRAGLQTDHLATSNPRSAESKYAFEAGRNDGYVTMWLKDEVKAEAKPMVRSGRANTQFQIDVLAGLQTGQTALGVNSDVDNLGEVVDTLRSYRFTFAGSDPSDEIAEDPARPVVSTGFYRIEDILQPDAGVQTGWKKPFAMLEVSARHTNDDLTDSKPWLYNNFVVEGGIQNSAEVGLTHQSYDLRLLRMTGFDSFPGGIEIDPDTNRGYFGASGSRDGGSSFVGMWNVPMAPAASLGALVHGNLVSGARLPRVVHPFGNARAHPLIPAGRVSRVRGHRMMDHSYLLNDALWDSAYFSSICAYGGASLGLARPFGEVLGGVLAGTAPALNSRMVALRPQADPAALVREIETMGEAERARKLAGHLAVAGPFNVNSTSVDAWRAVISSLRDRAVQSMYGASFPNEGRTPFVRSGRPLAGAQAEGDARWAGFRSLDDTEIHDLAKHIVGQIIARGTTDRAPSLGLAEFVNRRIGPDSGLHALAGLLQSAIDASGVNGEALQHDSRRLKASAVPARRMAGVETAAVLDGESAEGAPSILTQGDLMAALAPVVTVRGDSFKIRGYGEALSADGRSILARAWCELRVQRVPEYVDPLDPPDTAVASLRSAANRTFGRRFVPVSFRWLHEGEI